jgi:hypothetical protein
MLCPTPIPVVLSQNRVQQSELALPNTNVHVVPPPFRDPPSMQRSRRKKRTKPAVDVYRCLIHGIFRPETQVRLAPGPKNQNIKTIVEPNPTPRPERLFYDAVLRCMQILFCYKTVDR